MNHIIMWETLMRDVEASFEKFNRPSHRPRHFETSKGAIVFESPKDAINAGARESFYTVLTRMNELEGKRTKSPIITPINRSKLLKGF